MNGPFWRVVIGEVSMGVTVYSRPRCVQCTATEKALRAKGISFEMVDVTLDNSAVRKVQSLGYRQLPVVSVGGQHWSGFRPDKISTL